MELAQNKYYSYSDYLSWDDGQRYELIDGLPYLMSPGPTWFHQGVCMELSRQLSIFLKGKPYKVYAAPFDVRLNADTLDDTVVQPDIIVICDRSKLDSKGGGYKGAPDLVIEILSPSTARMDRITKYKKYLQAGVREYWIVDIDNKIVDVHILENSKYVKTAHAETETIPVHVLEGCMINLEEVFEDM